MYQPHLQDSVAADLITPDSESEKLRGLVQADMLMKRVRRSQFFFEKHSCVISLVGRQEKQNIL